MNTESVLFAVNDGVAVATLNEGARLNPLTEGLQQGLLDALQRVRSDTSIRALLLTATGRGFCVGADLPDLQRRARELPAASRPALTGPGRCSGALIYMSAPEHLQGALM
eukprot:gene3006-biopygen2212